VSACRTCGATLPEGARFCPSCGAATESGEATRERKVATVLFVDLVGSTELGEGDPERTRAVLRSFYDAMSSEVVRAGGVVEKFAGDAVMAAFGAPTSLEDHPERALHAALGMRRSLEDLFDGRLELRIGVNTGEVVVGDIREGSSFVTGDSVNVCARLEQQAQPGEILVGERTVTAARGAFEFDEPTSLAVKGKAKPVACRRLVRALRLTRPRGVRGARPAFVGRGAELELLRATFERALGAGQPHLVTVLGEAGVGKSRLVREFWEWPERGSVAPLRRTGRCLPYGQGITYWPLGEIVKEQLGLLDSDSSETVRAHLGDRELLGSALGLEVGRGLHPLAVREGIHDAWLDFVNDLIRERPTVLLVEDLHWAEEPLLDLLERTLGEVRGALLLLTTARPELLDRRRSWGTGRRNSSTIWLDPLSEADARRLLDELLAAELPDELRDVVVERAEGNPFFVEELTAGLIDRKVLERHNGNWTAAPLPADFAVPDSVQGVLAARIDLLGPVEKAALQAGAVIGRVFWETPVRELIDFADADFGVLEERDFVRRQPGSSMVGEREYAIKHALTREVAYASLPRARRARLHAKFARWLETLETHDELAALLAHHYAEAVNPEDVHLAWADAEPELVALRGRARHWLRRAAELALSRYEVGDARRLLMRALQLAEDDATRSDLWRLIGQAYGLEYDGPGFFEAMENAIELCSDRAGLADLQSRLALGTVNRSGMWTERPSREVVERIVDRALGLADDKSPARVRALVSKAFLDPGRSAALAEEASAIAERLDDPALSSLAWDARADVALYAGDYEQALAWGQRRADMLGEISDPNHVAYIHFGVIRALVALGRIDEGRRLARRYDETLRRLTPHHRVHGISLPLEIEALAGEWSAVADLQARVERTVDENLSTPCVRNPLSLLLCASAAARRKDVDEARRLRGLAEGLGMTGYDDILNTARLRLSLELGELDEVERLLAASPEALRIGTGWFSLVGAPARLDALAALGHADRVEAEAEPLLRPGTCLEPYALRALGVVRADERMIAQALERFERLGLNAAVEETRAVARST
jgi:class 3 adenylate cyclase